MALFQVSELLQFAQISTWVISQELQLVFAAPWEAKNSQHGWLSGDHGL